MPLRGPIGERKDKCGRYQEMEYLCYSIPGGMLCLVAGAYVTSRGSQFRSILQLLREVQSSLQFYMNILAAKDCDDAFMHGSL
jgi:poly(3-hydroxyalkanoate) synthetase